MLNRTLPFLAVFLIFFLVGCGTARQTKFRHYIQEKPRVDQEVSGKVGNWQNAPDAIVDSSRKQTRKMLIFEFSKEPNFSADDVLEMTDKKNQAPAPDGTAVSESMGPDDNEMEQDEAPNVAVDERMSAPSKNVSPTGMKGGQEYTIEKDDTLQKISQKFYGTTKHWMKIYEANKDVIENPDRVKPGMVISIPAL